jgi:putative mRNA 3-end processing factor
VLLRSTDRGLYCQAGDFHIDPWQPVDRAIITHAHGDHARWGSREYLAARAGERVLRTRLGPQASITTVEYGERVVLNGVQVSLHPAGHILGSSQIRVEHKGEVWVASGDYKTEPDETCTPFELVRCHTFITESTFGLPIYRWMAQRETYAAIHDWWRANADAGRASIIFAYALGKAQRLLNGLRHEPRGPVFTHGAVERLNADYRDSGVQLLPSERASSLPRNQDWSGALVIAPPSAGGSLWLRRFGAASTAFASGWMSIRGMRRRRSVDRGFVLSDHVDWPSLIATIRATGAERVLATHGSRESLVRWLTEHGVEARVVASAWKGELDDSDPGEEPAPEAPSEEAPA